MNGESELELATRIRIMRFHSTTVSAACEILRIVKLNLTHFSASRQDGSVKKQNHRNQISEQTGHSRDVGYV